MKILQLKLLAFGPFTDTLLDLQDGQEGLHIIYGPNEAGKSSALRALVNLLFGIPSRSDDNFFHPYSNLRIGGKLCRSDGTVLDCVRRKGQVNTLRQADDTTVIDESQINYFLSGVDAELFSTMFAIDHRRLVEGGQAILEGEGNIGQILFAAGAGISDLHKVQEQLESEAETLFKPAGHRPRINEAIAKFKEMQKSINEAQLPSQEWKRHDQSLAEATKMMQTVEEELGQKQRERQRLERIKEALPIISQRKELFEELKLFIRAVILPPDFSDRRREAMTNLRVAENDEKQALQSLGEIKESMKALTIPEAILKQAHLITQTYQELGSHLKAMKDHSRLTIQKESLENEARAILKELQPDLTLNQVDQLRISKAHVVRIQELGQMYQKLVTQLENSRGGITKLSLGLDRLSKEHTAFKDLGETGDLRKAIDRLRQQGNIEDNYKGEIRELQRDKQKAEIALKKFTLWTGPMEEIEKLPVPPPETIDTFERQLDEARDMVTRNSRDVEEIDRNLVEIDGQIEQLRLEQEVPTEADLTEARKKREAQWHTICHHLAPDLYHDPYPEARQEMEHSSRGESGMNLEVPPSSPLREEERGDFQVKEKENISTEDMIHSYELCVKQADDLSDRLRREADRVAKKATLLANHKTLINQKERLSLQLQKAEDKFASIKDEWSALWQKLGIIKPGSPREMRKWLHDQAILAGMVSAIRERGIRIDGLKNNIETYCGELSLGLAALGEPLAGQSETLTHLLERSQLIVDRLEEKRVRREQIERELKEREDELKEAKVKTAEYEDALVKWQSEWLEAVRPLGLDAHSSPGQANTMLQNLKELFDKIKESRDLGRRIEDIGNDASDFSTRVSRLVESIAIDLVNLPVEQAVMELNSRLTGGRTNKAKQENLEKQLQQQEDRLKKARNRIVEIRAQLMTMCEEAGCQSPEELPQAEDRSSQRQRIQGHIGQIEEQLRKLSAGATLDEFVREAQSIDPDSIEVNIQRLTEGIEELSHRKSQLDQTIGSEKNELSRMDGGAGAAELAQEAQGLLASLEGDIERYSRLVLASSILAQAIENYRTKNQGQIMNRSSELFRKITLGSFEGLDVEYNEQGSPILVGIRPGKKGIVKVEGMSEGTADQLYLAIRLAGLEAYLEKNEAVPFIVDDILIQFDDRRSAAALEVLSHLAGKAQVIFFTHHQHLVELAKANLDRSSLFIHSLEK